MSRRQSNLNYLTYKEEYDLDIETQKVRKTRNNQNYKKHDKQELQGGSKDSVDGGAQLWSNIFNN